MSENVIMKMLQENNPLRFWVKLAFDLLNEQRAKIKELDYVLIDLPEVMPALPEPFPVWRRLTGQQPVSLVDLEKQFRRIANDPRPQGVILYMRGFEMPLADLQTLRASIQRLREKGKRVVAYTKGFDLATYYIASVCDEIVMQPGGSVLTLGLRREATYLKDALDSVGVKFESVAISPYKSALEQLTESDISEENKEQINWLLDSQYDILIDGIAEGRGIEVEAVRQMIDSAPHTDAEAIEAGYVDALHNEEGLPAHLGVEHILTLKQAEKILLMEWRDAPDKFVALVRVSGSIVDGDSRRPPVEPPFPVPFVGGERSGDHSVVQEIRRVAKNEKAAAVVLFVDSPGGSATASEAMASALSELAKDRPVVVYMNNVAASGGYYVSTPGQWIVAQPGTITGSIGVILGKAVTRGLFEKLKINRIEFMRGQNAGILSDSEPFTDGQRDTLEKSIQMIYGQFMQRVAESRNMSVDDVDAIGGGRVWTGRQALENGLVDQLGDLRAALDKARELAGLPEDAPLMQLTGGLRQDPLPPQLFKGPSALLNYMRDGAKALNMKAQMLLPFDLR